MKAFSDILTLTPSTLIREGSGPWLPLSQQPEIHNTQPSESTEKRLPIDDLPQHEYQLCQFCPDWKRCDVTFLWDRVLEIWVTWDEYENLLKLSPPEPQAPAAPAEPLEDLNREIKRVKRKAYQERKKAKKSKAEPTAEEAEKIPTQWEGFLEEQSSDDEFQIKTQ